jgi:bacteriorhodopsin
MSTARLFIWGVVAGLGGLVLAMAVVDLLGIDRHPTDRDRLRAAVLVGVAVVAGCGYGARRRSRQSMPDPEDPTS